MKTILFVLAVIVCSCFFIVRDFNKRDKKNVKTLNHLLAMYRTDSLMEIRLKDQWNFVLYRMYHIGLITRDEYKEFKKEYKEEEDPEIFTFTTSISCLKNIDHIDFEIRRGRLDSIVIILKAGDNQTLDKLIISLMALYTTRFGEPMLIGNDTYQFADNDEQGYIYINPKKHSFYIA